MLNNKKIGTKIAIGIGVMVGIILIVMLVVAFNMNQIKTDSEAMDEQYVPEVQMASSLQGNINEVMLAVRQYTLTEDKAQVDIINDYIAKAKVNIEEGKALVEKYPNLVKLKEHIVTAEESLLGYETLINETEVTINKKAEAMVALNQAAQSMIKNVDDYIEDQNTKVLVEIKASALDKASGRTMKIKRMNEILDFANEIRIGNFKAQTYRDPKHIDDVTPNFKKIYDDWQKIYDDTVQQVNIDQLNKIKESVKNYETNLVVVRDNFAAMEELAAKRMEQANKVVDSTKAINTAGLTETQTRASDAVGKMASALTIMIAGFILAIVLGIIVNLYIIRNIKRGISRVTDAAKQLSLGDIDIELTVDSHDEIGMLTEAFGEMVDNIKEQAIAVSKIASGDEDIVINPKSDKDVLSIKLIEAVEKTSSIIADINRLAEAVRNGELKARGDATQYSGFWGQLVSNINALIEAFVEPLTTISDYTNRISRGEIPEKLTTESRGEFILIRDSLNNCIEAVNLLIEDTNSLIDGAVNGHLSVRADESRHLGDYRRIVAGVNKMLNAVIEPVEEAAEVLVKMSEGDFTARVRGDYKGDHAKIKNALNASVMATQEVIVDVERMLNLMAEKDFSHSVDKDYRGDWNRIKSAFNTILNQLNDVMNEINIAAEQVATASRQVSDSSQTLSQGSTEQASSIEEITASITEIAEQTRENAVNANKASELSVASQKDATEGNVQMKKMVESMSEIKESSTNISKIIKVIDDIAFQTNILALNAAVEAARAGEHGKGFAVVAEEVRNLAARSADAAKETTALIEESIQRVEDGTKIANNTAESLNKIVSGVGETAEIVGGIAKASNEQASAISQINEGVNQVSKVVQMNTATSEETAAASEEMSSQAMLLQERVSEFKLTYTNKAKKVKRQEPPKKAYRQEIALDDGFSGPDIEIHLDDSEFGKY